jgi:hypothetical protein
MVSKRRCPRTGVVNFYAESDPFLAVGSVIEVGRPAVYQWRCYLGEEPAAGVARDMPTAERRIAMALQAEPPVAPKAAAA